MPLETEGIHVLDVVPQKPRRVPNSMYSLAGVGPNLELKSQSLAVKPKRSLDLVANIWIDDDEPSHLGWPKRDFHLNFSSLSDVDIVGTDTHQSFLDGEEVVLPVWYAIRIRKHGTTFSEIMDAAAKNLPPVYNCQIFLNTFSSVRLLKTDEIRRSHIDIAIEFVPIDKKPREYRLSLKSWDGLDLIEVH